MLRYLTLSIFFSLVWSAPAPTKKKPPRLEDAEKSPDQNTGLYYDQYLQTVVKLLESDENFKKTMENANFEDIKGGKLSGELYKIPTTIRQKLDDVKKDEISRLRKILRVKMDLEKGRKVSQSGYLKQIANHLDSSNPHTFEAQDLTNLIKAATKDLENFEEKRHNDFKRYEMMKDLRRQDKLMQMSEEDRKKAEKEYQDLRNKHEDHPSLNHPGSKAQFDEVWKEKDGLVDENFDPKTFFIMHDYNGDGTLDPMELEALFEKELAKVYDSANPEDDMIEMEEERRRMREHVMKEVDINGDGLITLQEFLSYSKTPEFEQPDKKSYKSVDESIDEEDIYSIEDLDEFRKIIADREDELRQKLKDLKQQAQTVSDLKIDVENHERDVGEHSSVHEKESLKEKKQLMKEEERILQKLHEEIKEQSEEISDLREELKEQEEAANLDDEGRGKIQVIPDNLVPPGREKALSDGDKHVVHEVKKPARQ